MLFSKKSMLISNGELQGYKIIGSKIISGLIEIFLITVLVIIVIGFNLQLMNSNFIQQSLNVLQLSGINLTKEIPFFLIGLVFSYSLLLETIYLSMIIVKYVFIDFKYKKIMIFMVFNSISMINLLVIYGMVKNVVDFNTITVTIIGIKTSFLILLWYLLSGILLVNKSSSK
jgi:hypothetical protein